MVPGGRGGGWIGKQASRKKTERVVMAPMPRDVRAGLLEMVVGKGLVDDAFVELKALLL